MKMTEKSEYPDFIMMIYKPKWPALNPIEPFLLRLKKPGGSLLINSSMTSPKTTLNSYKTISASSSSDKSTKKSVCKITSKNPSCNHYLKTTLSSPNSGKLPKDKSPLRKKSLNLGSEMTIIRNLCCKPKSKSRTSGPNSRRKLNKKVSTSESLELSKSTPLYLK
jgi:hypothetical protein